MSKLIYTIGDKKNYIDALERHGFIQKTGKTETYEGGYAFKTYEDALCAIEELGQENVWVVFGLLADWEKDTEPNKVHWWHNLLKDSIIVPLDKSEERW